MIKVKDTMEEQARQEPFCVGCGRPKSIGLIVCWHCFKSRRDITPFKYYEGSFSDWLILSLQAR